MKHVRGGKQRRAELALAGITVVWGTTFVVVKGALADVSPVLFIALRFTLAFVALALIYGTGLRQKGIPRTAWLAGLLAGTLLFGAYVLQTIGLGLTTPSKSAFLTSLSIPMVPLTGSVVYGNRPRALEGAGIVIASFGMILMTLPGNMMSAGFSVNRGDLLTFFCAVLFAVHIVVIGHFSPVIGFESLAVVQIAVAAVLALVFVFFLALRAPVTFHPTAGLATAVLVTGLLATGLAFTTMAWAQQYTSSTRAALIFALEPVVAWLTSWLLTGEIMGIRGTAGAGLILAGILLVEFKPDLKRVKP
ncbi:MAG TPA: DMT family transporter [Bryobacteraceae bacterium]|nr:DMT family transporter [Bryobacteraceae bacterium]